MMRTRLAPGRARGAVNPGLQAYLRDQAAAASATADLFQRVLGTISQNRHQVTLRMVALEVEEDRTALLGVMAELGVEISRPREVLVVAARRATRPRPRRRRAWVHRRLGGTALTDLDAMVVDLEGRVRMWQALGQAAEWEPRLNPYQLERLVARSRAQQDQVERVRRECAASLFRNEGGAGG
jgi:sugar diacid utilization regulator